MPVESSFPISNAELFGRTQVHLYPVEAHGGVLMHKELKPFLHQLMIDANHAGFDLRIASGFRGFDRQRVIWNEKCTGVRPVLDGNGQALDVNRLSALEKVEAILHWSALPGASRHHWGTDCDIYDARAMPDGYQLKLVPSEYLAGGIFAPMMEWLQDYLSDPLTPDFYQPYFHPSDEQVVDMGVAPEPWHLSYRPIACAYQQALSCVQLKEYLQQLSSDHRIEEQEVVINHLESIFERFIALGY